MVFLCKSFFYVGNFCWIRKKFCLCWKLLVYLRKVLFMEETNEIIVRPEYMARIRPYIGKNVIKVLTGQRRVGKSYILKAVADEIRQNDPDANLVYIDLEDFAFAHVMDARALHAEISSRLLPQIRIYIFVDEIQEVAGFDKVIRSLILDKLNDVYVTGSNSAILSA